nr:retron Ec78 anti-phage system effector HNH endonuclease PtuB [Pigmentiphaga aceris]
MDEKSEIWTRLHEMQLNRCAYCECRLETAKGHIEHFRQRSRYKQGEFEWANLFGSCSKKESCGKFKDDFGNYDFGMLIKPDDDDPEEFLLFLPNGAVVPRDGIGNENHKRADLTIKVFGLRGCLDQIRKVAISGYVSTLESIKDLAEQEPDGEWREFLMDELNKSSALPHATAIKHVLTMDGFLLGV